ncbi:MAG: ABC transporter permease [Christensenellaceae bacterium]
MISLIVSAITISAVYLLGCVGEIITEKAGHLNLGIPGVMCVGAAGGCWGAVLYTQMANGNPNYLLLLITAVLFAFVFGALAGGIYAFITVTLRCNQNITGLALTTFGAGFAQTMMKNFVLTEKMKPVMAIAVATAKKSLPFAADLGAFGQIFLSHNLLFYVAIVIAIVTAVVLKRTRLGLHLRAVGEDPKTADATGINVTAYKYGAILTGSAIAGMGGMYYTLVYIGTWENPSTTEGFGWLCIALVIFTLWKPDLAILGSILFSVLGLLFMRVSGSWMYIFKMFPYIATIIVLVITSVIGSKENQPPKSLGLPYFREDR